MAQDTTASVLEPDERIARCLWPPNHRLVCLGREAFDPTLAGACDPRPGWRFTGCRSNQCDEAPCLEHPGENGDGDTSGDCIVAPKGDRVCLGAERAGTRPEGRTCSVEAVAEDA